MNPYARIMQGIGALAALVWLATLAQGYTVGAERQPLALHTIGALLAAALILLSRTWTLSFLLLSVRGGAPPAEAGAARRRALALGASLFSLASLGVVFLFSGRMLWHRITPVVHASVGGAALLTHLVALWCERRSLRDPASGGAGLRHQERTRAAG